MDGDIKSGQMKHIIVSVINGIKDNFNIMLHVKLALLLRLSNIVLP